MSRFYYRPIQGRQGNIAAGIGAGLQQGGENFIDQKEKMRQRAMEHAALEAADRAANRPVRPMQRRGGGAPDQGRAPAQTQTAAEAEAPPLPNIMDQKYQPTQTMPSEAISPGEMGMGMIQDGQGYYSSNPAHTDPQNEFMSEGDKERAFGPAQQQVGAVGSVFTQGQQMGGGVPQFGSNLREAPTPEYRSVNEGLWGGPRLLTEDYKDDLHAYNQEVEAHNQEYKAMGLAEVLGVSPQAAMSILESPQVAEAIIRANAAAQEGAMTRETQLDIQGMKQEHEASEGALDRGNRLGLANVEGDTRRAVADIQGQTSRDVTETTRASVESEGEKDRISKENMQTDELAHMAEQAQLNRDHQIGLADQQSDLIEGRSRNDFYRRLNERLLDGVVAAGYHPEITDETTVKGLLQDLNVGVDIALKDPGVVKLVRTSGAVGGTTEQQDLYRRIERMYAEVRGTTEEERQENFIPIIFDEILYNVDGQDKGTWLMFATEIARWDDKTQWELERDLANRRLGIDSGDAKQVQPAADSTRLPSGMRPYPR